MEKAWKIGNLPRHSLRRRGAQKQSASMAPKKLARSKAGAEQSKLEEESKEPKRNWLSTEDCTVAALADSVHKTLGKVSDTVKEAAMTARWPDALQLHYERVGWPSTSKKLDPPHTFEWSRDNRKKNKWQRWVRLR